jgi:hypothetical protein
MQPEVLSEAQKIKRILAELIESRNKLIDMTESEYNENIHNFIMKSILPYKINLYSKHFDYDNYGICLYTGYEGVEIPVFRSEWMKTGVFAKYTWPESFKSTTDLSLSHL